MRDSKGRAGGTALDPDREQSQRRAIGTQIAFHLFPAQEPRREKERVRAALLHVALCAAVEREEAVVHLLASERHGELLTPECAVDHLLLYLLRVFGRDGALAEGILVDERKPAKLLPGGEGVFEGAAVGTA